MINGSDGRKRSFLPKGKFRRGVIEPLEKLELKEGEVIFITIRELPEEDRFEKAAGGWKNLVDCEALPEDINESPKIKRAEIKL